MACGVKRRRRRQFGSLLALFLPYHHGVRHGAGQGWAGQVFYEKACLHHLSAFQEGSSPPSLYKKPPLLTHENLLKQQHGLFPLSEELSQGKPTGL